MISFQAPTNYTLSGRFAGKHIYGVDTETTLIPESVISPNKKTRLAAVPITDLVVGSLAHGAQYAAMARDEFCMTLAGLLARADTCFVFHNFAFDYFVINKASPPTGKLLRTAIRQGRVFDTQIREVLIQIADGRLTSGTVKLKSPHLADLTKRRLGITLDKDTNVRCNFGQYLGCPESDIPPEFLGYAALDARVTLGVFCAQEPLMASLAADADSSPYPLLHNATERFGLLAEHIQLRGAIALRWLEQFPLRTDPDAVNALHTRILSEYEALKEALVSYDLGKRNRKGKFHLKLKAVRALLTLYKNDHHIDVELTPSGLITTEYDFWAPHITRLEDQALPDTTTAGKLQRWLRYMKLNKLMSTYIHCYQSGPEHYTSYWNLGARTTRTSSSRPNVQNIPKHRDSLRSMFIPSPRHSFFEFDFSAAELAALAQVHLLMFGASTLADDINAGRDPHIETARRIYGAQAFDSADPAARKRLRQAAKAANFGFPGGLGPAKFAKYASRSYKVDLSIPAARELRSQFLNANPELRRYLQDHVNPETVLPLAASNLGITVDQLITYLDVDGDTRDSRDEPNLTLVLTRLRQWLRGDPRWQIPTPPGFRPMFDLFRAPSRAPCGVVRGRCSYTEAHNLPFQATVAAALKLGLWNLYDEWAASPVHRWRPVVQVHDSVLIEVQEGAEHIAPLLSEMFRLGLQNLLPDVRATVDSDGPKPRWGKAPK